MFIKFCYPAGSDVRPFLHKSSHKRVDGGQPPMPLQTDATDKDSWGFSVKRWIRARDIGSSSTDWPHDR